MVAKVISGQDIKGAINYNEHKVLQGKATLLQASGFIKEETQLNFHDKLTRFTQLNERNRRTKTNTLHISLNFDPSESLTTDQLTSIAGTYMNKIGFGDQPYLVYEHTDAAHPHVHIVTTIIQHNGQRIPIHYLGKNQSEKARKEIELEYNLIKAEGKKKQQSEKIQPADVMAIRYGKSETIRSIANIVHFVTRHYKYASLPELNAALRQYNVMADRGTAGSNMFEKKGLIYGLLDEQGNKIGIPIKASAISGKPTLSFLEKQFKLNDALRQSHKMTLINVIDAALQSQAVNTKQKFIVALKEKNIEVLFRTNAEGRDYGLTFIDNNTRSVFNGSALGKPFSAKAILETLNAKSEATIESTTESFLKMDLTNDLPLEDNEDHSIHTLTNTMKGVLTAELDTLSPEAALRLSSNKKKRKKRNR
jgi:hypothetical protein